MKSSKHAISLLLLDVDGVLTDGKLHIGAEGELFKSFNAKDGVAVALLRAHGIKTGIISGKSSAPLSLRASQLKLDFVITGCHDKATAYERIKQEQQLRDENIAFVGDDVIDLPVMQRCAISYAPADAHSLVLKAATYITSCKGGEGVGREVAEHLLLQQGMSLEQAYQPLLADWQGNSIQQ